MKTPPLILIAEDEDLMRAILTRLLITRNQHIKRVAEKQAQRTAREEAASQAGC